MDIQYLLWLQDFRNGINDAWTPFMEWISLFAINWMIMVPIFIYWNRDKKKGLYPLTAYYFCMFFTQIIKLTACVYRPWIRDPRIQPAGDAISTATGYSFPSGHTMTAAPLAGGVAVDCWQEKKTRWLSVIFVALVLVIAFSRNYLGVHTPQDVLVALTLSVLSLFFTNKLFVYLEEHPEKEDMLLLAGFILCCLALLYFNVKSYPTKYTSDGSLIVDPKKMMNDGYGDVGKTMGFIIARYVEKTWIRFKPTGSDWKGILVCLLGLVSVRLMKLYLSPVIVAALGSHWGKLTFSIIYTFYFIAFFPWLLNLYHKMTDKTDEPNKTDNRVAA